MKAITIQIICPFFPQEGLFAFDNTKQLLET